MTECTAQIDLFSIGRRTVTASFVDTPLTSDAGAVLLGRLDRQNRITERLAASLHERRTARKVRHTLRDLLRQRSYQIACGYEDASDANTLRDDPALQLALGRVPGADATLASQPTLSRFEQRRRADLVAFSEALCEIWVERLALQQRRSHRRLSITLDFDSTDFVTYGDQQLALFHGHYGHYIYYPLLVFDGEGWPVAALLRPGRTRSAGVVPILLRIVRRLVDAGIRFDITLRADAGFSSPDLYETCENLGIHYVIGLITHKALIDRLEPTLAEARALAATTGTAKIIADFSMCWGHTRGETVTRRIIAKAEITALGENPRFLITNMGEAALEVYAVYTGRGQCENRIKDLKGALFGDRMSCHAFAANQFRLLIHTTAYILMFLLRERLAKTALAQAQFDTLRIRVLKIAAVVRVTARRVWLELSATHPSIWLWPHLAPSLG